MTHVERRGGLLVADTCLLTADDGRHALSLHQMMGYACPIRRARLGSSPCRPQDHFVVSAPPCHLVVDVSLRRLPLVQRTHGRRSAPLVFHSDDLFGPLWSLDNASIFDLLVLSGVFRKKENTLRHLWLLYQLQVHLVVQICLTLVQRRPWLHPFHLNQLVCSEHK